MPVGTLLAYADHGAAPQPLPRDGGDSETILAAAAKAGIAVDDLAAKLQTDGAQGFVASWRELLSTIEAKTKVLA